ncbi:MAG: glycoside hydrolase family 3 C-terminal domain-containing protein [Alphaproteobacteria bacterium]|nr:glycoside hydrolase family 3 C-terminal domain-containing protein [Alphaproteobacteria bacterium]
MLRKMFLAACLIAPAAGAQAQTPIDPDKQAAALVKQMTTEERNLLLHGFFSRPNPVNKLPQIGAPYAAGYTPGIARLGIPQLTESDASLGVAWINGKRARGATALPSSMALAATWDLKIAYAGSAAIAQEARASGDNVLLAGGVNLTREPRNGRNFEYLGEDPLLAGTLAGETIRAIQDQHVMSTVKHYALNAQETQQSAIGVDISEAAARESDLLAFELAIERGNPGAVMCAYNHFNGPFSCGSDFLLNKVLKQDWSYPGFVMSDWGANHATADALAGLDRESGEEFDSQIFFGAPLMALDGKDPAYTARITDMNQRILRSMIANHLFDDPPKIATPDIARGEAAARAEAATGTVLLKNNGILPLLKTARRIAVIGGYANIGVMSGGGSSQVAPQSGPALAIPTTTAADDWQAVMLHPGAPVKAILARTSGTRITFDTGAYPAFAAARAKDADIAIVFATQWTTEGLDVPDLNLPSGQNELIAAVAAANPRTIVVLETGGPVLMPWLDKTAAVLEAWYPGIRGADAIADILFGDVNPSGRLPITFPAALEQMPRPRLDGLFDFDGRQHVNYDIEGSDVGYRWYDRKGLTPLFPFGFGLSYTSFRYDDLKLRSEGNTIHASFTVTNTGSRAGRDTPQVYVTARGNAKGQRLIGWGNVELAPGASTRVIVDADPRLLADWSSPRGRWAMPAGRYDVTVNSSAANPVLDGATGLEARLLPP